jgi:hypothetical protein
MCGRLKKDLNGLFCANFAASRSRWQACKSLWFRPYYSKPQLVTFNHFKPANEEGFQWTSDKDQHLCTQDGDHLTTPFQCDLCVFRNDKRLQPGSAKCLADGVHLTSQPRCTLGTRNGNSISNLVEHQEDYQNSQAGGSTSSLPRSRPLSPHDTMGHAVAIAMLLKYHEPRRYAAGLGIQMYTWVPANTTIIFGQWGGQGQAIPQCLSNRFCMV